MKKKYCFVLILALLLAAFPRGLNTYAGDDLSEDSYSVNRADYPGLSDADFANFRMVRTTGMGPGMLYRTSSPVDPSLGRNTYADDELRKAGVTVIMNLADTEETLMMHEGYENTYYSTVLHIALDVDSNYYINVLNMKLARGFRFFAEHEGIYAVHCTMGKDRAGFAVAVLECLMGASLGEVTNDYMISFYNYYGARGVNYGWQGSYNILHTQLKQAFKVNALSGADLAEEAWEYLKEIGLSDAEIAALKTNLSDPAVNSWIVSFDENGGSGYMAGIAVDKGACFVLPECGFKAPEDMEFSKWNKGAPGDTIYITSDTVIRPEWKESDRIDAFVRRLYRLCLLREPDEQGFADWTGKLRRREITGALTARNFIFSREFKNRNYCDECYVKLLYRAFLDREYDEEGFELWTGKLKNGWKRQQVFNGFTQSREFKNICERYGIERGAKVSIPTRPNAFQQDVCPECGAPPDR